MTPDTLTHTTTPDPMADYARLEDFAAATGGKITATQLRWLARSRDRNGLTETGAIVCVCRKLYVHAGRFADWFAAQRG